MASSPHKYNGILLIDKTTGMTSHDVVQKIRRHLGMRRIGHTGTLDPNATGLLVVCLGNATKVVQFLTDSDKEYEAEIYLGMSSVTFDAEGIDDTQRPAEVPDLDPTDLEQLLADFRGTIQQVVPAYSAVHVNGRRLHEMARKGEDVQPPTREVEISSITVSEFDKPFLRLLVRCSSGTYIRSLAHDIGQKLGCGAYLSNLRRTSIGIHSVDDALTLEDLPSLVQTEQLQSHMLGIGQVLNFAAFTVSDAFRPRVLMGSDLHKDNILAVEGTFAKGDEVLLKDSAGSVLAVGHAQVSVAKLAASHNETLFSYIRVLN
ncbi:MAG: tRNA pseudouridine(55) synthase TruB [candidate division Zixibacteria bacterium]|nr:tRNA pseudouridine(55) synthase TruB [candidate division Zixibacteria bacterium]